MKNEKIYPDSTSHEREEMSSLVECLASLQKDGFTADFYIEESILWSLDTLKSYHSGEVRIVSYYRFEGDSDPDDNAILYAIETNDGERGTLADAYGAYSDIQISDFMEKVLEIEKSPHKIRP